MGALRATNLNLNPIPDRNVIKVPIPKYGSIQRIVETIFSGYANAISGGRRSFVRVW